MGVSVESDAKERELLSGASRGDSACLASLFTRYRERLKRMVGLRLDARVRGRIDPSDVVQEAYVEVAKKLEGYLQAPSLPFFLWVRLLTAQKLALAHRQHLGVKARDAGREIALYRGYPAASSAALAARLMGKLTTPSQAAVKAELKVRIQQALNGMEPIDREILTLRHFEQLSNSETALVLGIKEPAACNRYFRALERLRDILGGMSEEW